MGLRWGGYQLKSFKFFSVWSGLQKQTVAKAEVNARSMLVRSTHDGIDVIKSSLVLSIVGEANLTTTGGSKD